ncbi:MAG: tyrosine-type recombinase/integrase [Clostridiales bacterium]|nr:tyrosine-type recombinase/integrase [Clostridiales bacterium]
MDYYREEEKKNIEKAREIIDILPSFCRGFFRYISETTSARTRLGYARDLKVFFGFLIETNRDLRGKDISEITLKNMNMITAEDLEEYLEYLSYYKQGEKDRFNGEKGKSRKLSAVRRLFSYLYKKNIIISNPGELVDTPKIHNKSILTLEPAEVSRLIDIVKSGEGLSPKEKQYHDLMAARDTAIITLFLGTGIRVSECVGIDINDIDFGTNGIRITRKGGNEVIIYFGAEVEEALYAYLAEREGIKPLAGSENALFLSMQKKRIGVRAVQKLVKKYSEMVTTLKKITPHKLRSTYGTALYRETGDIYLVADVLGHSDVNTTKTHYAKLSDENRRHAANAVKLGRDSG